MSLCTTTVLKAFTQFMWTNMTRQKRLSNASTAMARRISARESVYRTLSSSSGSPALLWMQRKVLSLHNHSIWMIILLLRDAFKKNVTNVTLGGGLAGQNVTFYKVVFKIHFKPFRPAVTFVTFFFEGVPKPRLRSSYWNSM